MWRPHDIVCAMITFSGALIIANESVWAAGDPVTGKDIATAGAPSAISSTAVGQGAQPRHCRLSPATLAGPTTGSPPSSPNLTAACAVFRYRGRKSKTSSPISAASNLTNSVSQRRIRGLRYDHCPYRRHSEMNRRGRRSGSQIEYVCDPVNRCSDGNIQPSEYNEP